jgi:hypothetical protein
MRRTSSQYTVDDRRALSFERMAVEGANTSSRAREWNARGSSGDYPKSAAVREGEGQPGLFQDKCFDDVGPVGRDASLGAGRTGGLALGWGGLSESLSEDTRRGRDRRSCADDVGEGNDLFRRSKWNEALLSERVDSTFEERPTSTSTVVIATASNHRRRRRFTPG